MHKGADGPGVRWATLGRVNPQGGAKAQRQGRELLDLALAVAIALAAVGTAWAGFESAKWSGVQANSYAQASARQAQSTRLTTASGQYLVIDVVSFNEWAAALDRETGADPVQWPDAGYRPDRKRLSGILFDRFRPEFKRAVVAWLATRPMTNPAAPATPFLMPEYKRFRLDRSAQLLAEAERLGAKARTANQRSDNYVLTAVLFALVLFFASVTKESRGRSTKILFVVTVTALIGALILLAIYPVEV